ncbi:MAG TPA: hypothetical protein VGH19_13345 [Verrucomicrobiae bacterium]
MNLSRTSKRVVLAVSGLLLLVVIGLLLPPIETKNKAESQRIKTAVNRVDQPVP